MAGSRYFSSNAFIISISERYSCELMSLSSGELRIPLPILAREWVLSGARLEPMDIFLLRE